MNNEFKLTKDMSVYSSDDKKVGEIKRVVIDPVTQKVSHLVIEQGFIFTEDKVLPIAFVSRQQDNRIYLSDTSDALDLQDFEETYYVRKYGPNHKEVVPESEVNPMPALMPMPYYYYPPATGLSGRGVYAGYPTRVNDEPAMVVKRENVPDGARIIDEGANIYSTDGDHVGDVHSVHIDSESNRVSHIVISQGLLFHDYKVVPSFWVKEVNEDGIQLAVSTKQLEQLEAVEPDNV